MRSSFRIFVFLFLLGFVWGQIADTYCMLKFKDKTAHEVGTSFFWATQPSVDTCKNLCMVRKDCISLDYDPDGKMCRLYRNKGVFDIRVLPDNSIAPNTATYIKYPTADCSNSSPLEAWVSTKSVVTNADGIQYNLISNVANVWMLRPVKA